jgi:hypothetical protein
MAAKSKKPKRGSSKKGYNPRNLTEIELYYNSWITSLSRMINRTFKEAFDQF